MSRCASGREPCRRGGFYLTSRGRQCKLTEKYPRRHTSSIVYRAMTLQPQHETAQLPVPLAPELLLAVHPDKGPIIVDIAPRLASWTGHAVAELVGQPLEQAFHEVMPGLPVVVEEVLRSGMPVHDYRLTYTDHDGVQRTLALQAGLRPGSQAQPYM